MTTRNIQVGSLFPQLDQQRYLCYRKYLADCWYRRKGLVNREEGLQGIIIAPKILDPTVGLDKTSSPDSAAPNAV